MGFWNSKLTKARKEHKCEYCGKKIEIGENYHRETGTWEGEFNDYCLCERCKYLVLKFENFNDGDCLGSLQGTLDNSDLLLCPTCKTPSYAGVVFSADKMSCECDCRQCKNTFVVDLTLDALEKAIEGLPPKAGKD